MPLFTRITLNPVNPDVRKVLRSPEAIHAVGSAASAIELTCDQLERCCGANFAGWVDVCKGWQEETDG